MKIKQIVGHFAREAREGLNYVSEHWSPFVLRMGIQVARLEDECIELRLPRRWRNLGYGSEIHPAALITLAIQAGELFWQRHLDPHLMQRLLRNVECSYFGAASGPVTARLAMREEERERLLFDVRRDSQSETSFVVRVFNRQEQLIAEIRVHWKLRQTLALSAGRA